LYNILTSAKALLWFRCKSGG